MTVKNLSTKAAAAIGLALVASVPASAQSATPIAAPTLSFSSSQRDTWHTVLIVSAIVGVVGIIQGDSTLTVLGGVGVLVSLVESEQMKFRFKPQSHGLDLLKMGPVSLGVNPLGKIGIAQAYQSSRPTAYMQLTFKF
jgi:hypothetical protein